MTDQPSASPESLRAARRENRRRRAEKRRKKAELALSATQLEQAAARPLGRSMGTPAQPSIPLGRVGRVVGRVGGRMIIRQVIRMIFGAFLRR